MRELTDHELDGVVGGGEIVLGALVSVALRALIDGVRRWLRGGK